MQILSAPEHDVPADIANPTPTTKAHDISDENTLRPNPFTTTTDAITLTAPPLNGTGVDPEDTAAPMPPIIDEGNPTSYKLEIYTTQPLTFILIAAIAELHTEIATPTPPTYAFTPRLPPLPLIVRSL